VREVRRHDTYRINSLSFSSWIGATPAPSVIGFYLVTIPFNLRVGFGRHSLAQSGKPRPSTWRRTAAADTATSDADDTDRPAASSSNGIRWIHLLLSSPPLLSFLLFFFFLLLSLSPLLIKKLLTRRPLVAEWEKRLRDAHASQLASGATKEPFLLDVHPSNIGAFETDYKLTHILNDLKEAGLAPHWVAPFYCSS